MPQGAPRAHLVTDVPPDGWHAWQSSNVIGGRYDPQTRVLWIRFTNAFYAYSEVPPDVWQGLVDAPSKGKYWHPFRFKFPYSGPLAAP